MDAVFSFLFGTRTGFAILFAGGILLFAILAFVMEKRTHKMYVDRGPSPRTKKTASGTSLPKRDRFILAGFIWANASAPQLELSQSRGAFRTCNKTAGKTCQNKPVPKWRVLLEGGVDGLDQSAAHAGVLERDDALDGGATG